MGISAEALKAALDAVAAGDSQVAAALAQAGYPEPRISAPGYQTLLRAIVGQQVSVQAAASMWAKLTAAVGDPPAPERLLEASDETLRAAGLSRQKASYARSLADIWPAGDLAVQIEVGRIIGLDAKPSEKALREIATRWAPHRGAMAIFAWHHRKIVPI
jgi:DNA-3-methyladenine glycosylase II